MKLINQLIRYSGLVVSEVVDQTLLVQHLFQFRVRIFDDFVQFVREVLELSDVQKAVHLVIHL